MRFVLFFVIILSAAVAFAAGKPCSKVPSAASDTKNPATLINDNALTLPENVEIDVIKKGSELGVVNGENAEIPIGIATINTVDNTAVWQGKPLENDAATVAAQEIFCDD